MFGGGNDRVGKPGSPEGLTPQGCGCSNWWVPNLVWMKQMFEANGFSSIVDIPLAREGTRRCVFHAKPTGQAYWRNMIAGQERKIGIHCGQRWSNIGRLMLG
jgi:hypothetical protein